MPYRSKQGCKLALKDACHFSNTTPLQTVLLSGKDYKKASSKILRCLLNMQYAQILKEIHRQKENQRLQIGGVLKHGIGRSSLSY